MMQAGDVLEILGRLQAAGVHVWIDGGWGIDGLVREQTREHDDLDVVIALTDALPARSALAAAGFVVAEDELPTRFVVRDRRDRRVDFHTVTFREDGSAIQQLQDGTPCTYPAAGFSATGCIGGWQVACLTAEAQLRHHLGYDPVQADIHDMALLADRFQLVLPPPYAP